MSLPDGGRLVAAPRRSPIRVAVLTETFAKGMGYAGSMLPKYLARLGADVHVITMDLSPYHSLAEFQQIYGGITGADAIKPGTVERYDGYHLHVLGHARVMGYMRMVGLGPVIAELRPDVVQTFAAIGPIPMDAALLRLRFGYKLFTGNHTTASVFPLAQAALPCWHRRRLQCLALRSAPGRVISWFTERCYGATVDCGEVAVKFFGVPRRKLTVCPLGVDSEVFHPAPVAEGAERAALRRELGFADHEIVCIYTGRFTEAKNPALLAEAVARLARQGRPFRGLFLGSGPQQERLQGSPACSVLPFRPVNELGRYFRASEIGVWPTQESTSMLDAAACGLPIVVNDTLQAGERVEGNGLRYRLNDLDDLVAALRRLEDPALRSRLGSAGAEKMRREYSWESIARRRLADYQRALEPQPAACAGTE